MVAGTKSACSWDRPAVVNAAVETFLLVLGVGFLAANLRILAGLVRYQLERRSAVLTCRASAAGLPCLPGARVALSLIIVARWS